MKVKSQTNFITNKHGVKITVSHHDYEFLVLFEHEDGMKLLRFQTVNPYGEDYDKITPELLNESYQTYLATGTFIQLKYRSDFEVLKEFVVKSKNYFKTDSKEDLESKLKKFYNSTKEKDSPDLTLEQLVELIVIVKKD